MGGGARLDQFELMNCVGGGGMGRVFRAQDTALDRTVAIKILSREQAADPETLLRFRNEAKTAARLNHENIVQAYCAGEAEGLAYIAFEFIEGPDIRALVERKGPLPLAEAVSYTFQIAEALAHAASRNVVHRDIKPSNVLITEAGRVKLIDMGLARMQKLNDPAGDLTASGVTLGTFDYISPEQARDPRTADVRSDIYSLGCTLFFMLAGRPPFPEGTVLQKLLQHQGEEPPDVRVFRPELPEEVSKVVRRMMAKDPRRRYQTPAQLIRSLVSLAEQVGLSPAGPGETMWSPVAAVGPTWIQRHLPWAVPVGMLLAIVTALHFLWSLPQEGNAPAAASISAGDESLPAPLQSDKRSAASNASEPPNASRDGVAETPTSSPPASESPDGQKLTPRVQNETSGKRPGTSKPPAGGLSQFSPNENGTVPVHTAQAGAEEPRVAATGEARRSEPAPADAAQGAAAKSPTPSAPQSGGSKDSGTPSESQAAAPQPSSPQVPGSASAGPLPGGTTKRPGVLVVGDTANGETSFPSLAAAYSRAKSGGIIELRYDGPHEEKPLDLTNAAITVRAGEGYHPTIVFRPNQADPVRYPRAMLTLAGSQLTLVNLAVELDVPHDLPADQWSLAELRQSESLRLEKCVLTIRNSAGLQAAYHPDVAFFRFKPAPGADEPMPEATGVAVPRATIALTHCIARGEATFVRVHGPRPFRLTWDNGLLATSERLLVADDGGWMPQPGDNIEIDLQHLTAVMRGGLCRIGLSELTRRPFGIQFTCANSILIGNAASPLVEETGVETDPSFRERLVWNGDRNFYEGFTVFWSFRRGDLESPPESLSFDAWRTYWGSQRENLSATNVVRWQYPPPDLPIHSHTPADYTLAQATADTPPNPAVGAASDKGDAGFRAADLPQLLSGPQTAAKPDRDAVLREHNSQ
ncbi:MAG: protein kinase domain-containing protein [Thermoguttaceae bacterium]